MVPSCRLIINTAAKFVVATISFSVKMQHNHGTVLTANAFAESVSHWRLGLFIFMN